MAYQIIGIRSRYNERTRKDFNTDEFYAMRWRFEDPSEIFRDPIGVMDRNKIPLEERYNLYYTVANCGDGKRQFKQLEQLAFDVDKLDTSRIEEYIDPVLEVLGRPDATVVGSGNGLHFIFPITNHITTPEEHAARKPQYLAILNKINSVLERLGLPGAPDPTLWDMARILRIPETKNIKKKEGKNVERRCVVLRQGLHVPAPFDWEEVSGFTKLEKGDTLAQDEMRRYKTHDGSEAMKQCGFLQHAKDDAATLTEPEWYAAAGLIARFDKGRELFHEISKAHSGYSPSSTDRKLDQALANSLPRTCASIQSLWGNCVQCPLWGKIKTPMSIMRADVIPTEATGFHYVGLEDARGRPRPPLPDFEGLRRAFERDYHYFVDLNGERTMVFDKTHWRASSNLELYGFAETNFNPPVLQKTRAEFAGKVNATNHRSGEAIDEFFYDSISGKLNLQNGILDIRSGVLEPHSPDYGFTYVLPYAYDPAAKAPTFEQFLKDVTLGREELAKTLLDFMGYVLVPGYDDHCFLWLTGTGRNGKSTFMEVLASMVGKSNTTSLLLSQFGKQQMVELMNHKLLNFAEESDDTRVPGGIVSTLKALSSGGTVQVDQKYISGYAMRATAKLVFSSNVAPTFAGVDQALLSRMILTPFDMKLEDSRYAKGESKIDSSIKQKMLAELPGILNLALRAVQEKASLRYRVHRSSISDEMAMQSARESDSVEDWVQERAVIDRSAETELATLYNDYKLERTADGGKACASSEFSKRLLAKFGNRLSRTRIGKQCTRGIKGIRLRTASDNDAAGKSAEY